MANSPITTSLPDYVEQQRLPLIAKSVLSAKSAKLFTLQSGVKGETALNLISTDVVFGDGSDCGWDEAGASTLSQRNIKPAALKVNMGFCDKKLLGTWAQYQVKVAAGIKELPFEEDFVNGIIDNVKAGVEKMVWQGDSASSAATEFDGILTVLSGTSAVTVDASSAATVYEAIVMTENAIPAAAYKEDTVIFCGMDTYRQYIQDLVAANLFHYNPANGENEYKLPGTGIRVIGVDGLNGTDKILSLIHI